MISLRVSMLCVLSLAIASTAAAVEVELLAQTDPSFQRPAENITVSPNVIKLWLSALQRDEADLKMEAARAFAKASSLGLQPTDEVLAELQQQFNAKEQPPIVQLELARSLVKLNVRDAAEDLYRAAHSGGLQMKLIVEPALADWDFQPIREVWRQRLSDPDIRRRELGLAIDGLEKVRDPQAAKQLTAMASDKSQPLDVRMQAARAASEIQQKGLEDTAAKLAAGTSPHAMFERLIAATLIRHHSGQAAEELLLKLAADQQPAVAAIALQRLLEMDANLVEPFNEKIVASEDTKIRRLAVAILQSQQATSAVELLGPLLDDVHPGVRRDAREALISLGGIDELHETVCNTATQMLQSDRVRGLEQAVIVVGALDYELSADRLVDLLEHKDPRVFVTAAWALRKLAVPETVPPILKKIREETAKSTKLQNELDKLAAAKKPFPPTEHLRPVFDQLSHLFEALGVIGDRDAMPLFEKFYPKPPRVAETDPPPVETTRQNKIRASMICGLGHMWKGEPDEKIADYMAKRLKDKDVANPESEDVKVNCAVALTRINAKQQVPAIEDWFQPKLGYSRVTHACGWALERLAGREPYQPEPINVLQAGWFLEPLRN